MSSFHRLIGATALSTVLSLVAGCGPQNAVTIDVSTGQILAVELGVDSVSYWLLDGSGAVTSSQLDVTPVDSLTINSDDAAGLYVTTANHTAAPDYTVSVSGTAQVAFSYLDHDEPGLADLRDNSDGTEMAGKHDEIETVTAALIADWGADLDAMRDALATQAYDEVLAASAVLEAGAGMLVDGSLDDINAETAPLAPWVLALEDLSVDLEAEVYADEVVADGIALDMSSYIPDETALEAAILDCIDPEAVGDEIEGYVDDIYGELIKNTREGFVDDGNDDDGNLTNEKYEYFEDILSEQLDGIEVHIEDVQACVEAAIGGEPSITYDDITVAPYEAIQAEVEAAQATYDHSYTNTGSEPWDHSALDSNAGLADPGDDFAPADWMAPATDVMDALVLLLGAEMFEAGSGTGTGTTPSSNYATAKTGSSAGACGASGFVFDLNGLGVPVIIGTPFDDNIIGNDIPGGLELLIGGKGDDCINARSGHELIIGGLGDDELHGGDQHELIIGSGGDDLIYTGYGDSYNINISGVSVELDLGSVAFGGADADVLSGSDPAYDPTDDTDQGYTDLLFGDGINNSGDDDTLDGGAGIDFLFGQRGDDTLINTLSGAITIDGGDVNFGSFHFTGRGDDTAVGSDSFDLIFGSDGNDDLSGNDGVDLIFGGSGEDLADGGAQPDLVLGGSGDDSLSGGDGIDLVIGGLDDDTISGGAGLFDLLISNAGHDTVDGNDGMDLIFAGSDQDFANGNDGIDFVVGGQDNDSLSGGAGIDILLGGAGRDWIDGGDSIDLLIGSDEVDVLRGGDGLDVLLGGDGDDWIEGGSGLDLIWGYAGVDTAFGGDGVDVAFGNDGGDCLYGDAGVDLIFGSDGDDELHGGAELDLVVGSDGDDALYGDGGTDILLGSVDSDYLSGGDGVNLMFGGDAEDTVIGGAALDLVFAGDSDDCVDGGGGFDITFGGDGADTGLDLDVVFGGAGDDAFEAEALGFGGDGDDTLMTLSLSTTFGGLLLGSDGEDWLYVDAGSDTTNLVLGSDGEDIVSAPGATDPSLSAYPRQITLGGDGGDWLQTSVGRNFAFGNRGDDTISGDHDGGSSSTEDRADFLFGNKDDDHLYGDQSDKKDWMFRGSGSGQSRTHDAWPSTTPSWSGTHAAPSLGSCAPAPVTQCTQMEPPSDVGAK